MSCSLVKLQYDSGTPFRQAIGYILSTQKINGGKGTVVGYQAGYHINLMPGFHAEATVGLVLISETVSLLTEFLAKTEMNPVLYDIQRHVIKG